MLLKIKALIGDEELKEKGEYGGCGYTSESEMVLFST
jgi:hypothetical protein